MSQTTEENYPQAPVPAKKPHARAFHGDAVEDPYYWLRDKNDPEVIAHLEAENAYYRQRTAHLSDLTEKLYQAMKGYLQETDVKVPVREGNYWYLLRTSAGEQYPRFTRVPATSWEAPDLPVDELGANEQVLIDGPKLAAGHEFFQLGGVQASHDHSRLAYLVDFTGDERMQICVIDANSGEMIDDSVTNVGYGLGFSADDTQVYYVRVDDAWRSYQLWRHTLGADPETDELLYTEEDEVFDLWFRESAARTHLIVGSISRTSAEYRILDLAHPERGLQLVCPRTPNLEYEVEVADNELLIVHNHEAEGFALARAPLGESTPTQWENLLVAQPGERIEGITFLERAVLVSMRSAALPTVRVIPRAHGEYQVADLFDLGTGGELDCVSEYGNEDVAAPCVTFKVSSLLRPETVMRLDLQTRDLVTVKVQEVPGFDASRYREKRLWATAADGVKVPISLLTRADVEPDGTNPGILYGYGSYEASMQPTFKSMILSLVDRGVVYAIAHIRGGGEMGRPWYLDGKLLKKKNTFTDFIACAHYLQETGWVAKNRLAAFGASAGGLLMGAVANMAPDTFQAIHAGVPFVDALTTILDPSLPLTAGEWEEWGNPIESKEVYDYMKSYTPYENIAPRPYPAILATTSLNDTRVFFVEPTKWVARLRETVTSDQEHKPILLRCEMVAGHGGASGRYDRMRQFASEMAFLLDHIE